MPDIQAQIQTDTARLSEVERLILEAEKNALAHEEKARHYRNVERENLKQERASLITALTHNRVIKETNAAADAAQKAQAEVEAAKQAQEKLLKELEAKSKELDSLLAKAKAKPEPE